jgi:hypothetical protein
VRLRRRSPGAPARVAGMGLAVAVGLAEALGLGEALAEGLGLAVGLALGARRSRGGGGGARVVQPRVGYRHALTTRQAHVHVRAALDCQVLA